MKILITGSHFTPAQATIDKLQKYPNVEIVYVGRKSTKEGDSTPSVESKILPKLGIKFTTIVTGRLQRVFTLYTISSLLKIPIGIIQSFYIILKEKPDVILSFGGYVAVPLVVSAWLLSIPIIIHEQTLVSGLANTISSYFADKIAISFDQNKSFNNTKTILTGNPMRTEITHIQQNLLSKDVKEIVNLARKEKLPLVLITGGNQGSHIINIAVANTLTELTKITFVIHQTGDSKFYDFENLVEQKAKLQNPERYLVRKWIEDFDLALIFKNIDLAVSRAGMNALQEFAYFAIPTIVIPFPYLYKDEQNVNANFFANLGLVKKLPQKDLSSSKLLTEIKYMIKNITQFQEDAKNAKKIIITGAAQTLALETVLLVETHQ